MKTPTLTINIAGKLTLDRDSLEQFLRSVTPLAPPISSPRNQSQPRTDESNFIDEKQLLKKLAVSRRTIFSWRKAGKIPTVKLGRRILFHWPSVEAALLRYQRGEGGGGD